MSGVVGEDLIQLGPSRVSAAQLAFHVLLSDPPDDRPPTNAPHIDVYEGDITSGSSSKGCVLTTLFAMPRRISSVSSTPRSWPVNVLVGDDPSDLLATGVNDAPYTLVDSGENYIGREDEFISRPKGRSRRKRRKTRIVGRQGGRETPFSSIPRREIWRNTASARSRALGFRILFSANSSLYQTVDDFDGLRADFDCFATDRVGLGQNRARS